MAIEVTTRAKRSDAGVSRTDKTDYKGKYDEVVAYCKINVELLGELMPASPGDPRQAEFQTRIDVLKAVLRKLGVEVSA